MAVAIRQQKVGSSSASATPLSFDALPLVGSVIVAIVAERGGEHTVASNNAGFTSYGFASSRSDAGEGCDIGSKPCTDPAADQTVTIHAKVDAILYELTGADSTVVEALVVSDGSASATMSAGTFASIPAGAMAFLGIAGSQASGSFTPASGWTEDSDGANSESGAAPIHFMGHTTTSTDATATATSSAEFGAIGIVVGPEAIVEECDSPVAFDVYSLGTATSPALTYLATLCDAFDKSFRIELDGTGSGKFSINRSSADATAAILGDGDGDVRYIQVRIPGITGWTSARFGFFIEEGDFRLLDSAEQGGQTLTFTGHGSLAYLDFAVMGTHSYITGGMDPYTGLWRLYPRARGRSRGRCSGGSSRRRRTPADPRFPCRS